MARTWKVPLLISMAVLLALILTVLFVIAVLIRTGHTYVIPLAHNNCGNQLIWYATGMYEAFIRERDFQSMAMVTNNGHKSYVSHMHMSVPFVASGFREHLAKGESEMLPYCSLHYWASPSIWAALRTPLAREVERALPPAESIAHGAGVIHFRCSDAPFDRNPDYGLTPYRWWRQALRLMPSDLRTCYFLFCFVHFADETNGEAAQSYAADLLAFLRAERPHVHFVQRCGPSVEADMQLLRHARFMVSAGSTFSFTAAMTGRQERAVIMRSRKAPVEPDPATYGVWPKHVVELQRDMLLHADVPDYLDVGTVLAQLRVGLE